MDDAHSPPEVPKLPLLASDHNPQKLRFSWSSSFISQVKENPYAGLYRKPASSKIMQAGPPIGQLQTGGSQPESAPQGRTIFS